MKYFIFILLSFVIFSCADNTVEETDSVLKSEPYTTVTDSIQMESASARLYYQRGVLLMQNEQFNYAEKDFKKAWSLEPTEQNALGVITVLRRKNTDSAISFIEQALNKIPESIPLKISLARGYLQKENFEKAIT